MDFAYNLALLSFVFSLYVFISLSRKKELLLESKDEIHQNRQGVEKDFRKRSTLILWLIIILLLGILAFQNFARHDPVDTQPALGELGTEYWNSDMIDQTIKAISGKIGASAPASVKAEGGKAAIQIKNIGGQTFVPYCIVDGEEVYRSSKVLNPGERVIAVVPVTENATQILTMVESVEGGKFSITSKVVR